MNKFKRIVLAIIFGLMLPATAFLTACGATPSSAITGIVFDAKKYDENGVAVFEVDRGVTTDLEYKIFPSSASGYKVYFDPIDKGTAENSSRYKFEDGQITVNQDNFEDVRYRVRVGEYSDECIIRLKEYPVEIWTDETEITINTDSIKAINVSARFKNALGNYTTKNITEEDYDFLVETDDETIINIPNENRLKFSAIRNEAATANVTVTILNTMGGRKDLKFNIKVNVVPNISNAYVIMTGVSKNIYNGDEVELNYSSEKLKLDSVSGGKIITFNIFAINSNNILYEGNFDYCLNISSKTLASVNYVEGKPNGVLLSPTIKNGDKFLLSIIITNNLNNEDNTTFVFNINIKIVGKI